MIKQLFHGLTEIITSPQYGKGKPYNDYGLKFYRTENSEMAKEWAVQKDRIFEISSPLQKRLLKSLLHPIKLSEYDVPHSKICC